MIKVTVTGFQDVARRIEAQKNRFMRATERAVYDQLAKVAARSTELVPVDTGDLRDSIRVSVTKASRASSSVRGEISYNTDYAESVHERVEVPHRTGQAKFLETAWVEEMGAARARMAAFISRARSSGAGGFALSDSFATPKRGR